MEVWLEGKEKKDKRAKERLVEKKMNREREGVLNRSYCGEHWEGATAFIDRVYWFIAPCFFQREREREREMALALRGVLWLQVYGEVKRCKCEVERFQTYFNVLWLKVGFQLLTGGTKKKKKKRHEGQMALHFNSWYLSQSKQRVKQKGMNTMYYIYIIQYKQTNNIGRSW